MYPYGSNGYGRGGRAVPGRFNTTLPVRHWSLIEAKRKKNLDDGDKIILSYELLSEIGIENMSSGSPLIFAVTNLKTKKVGHCGVLEFSGQEPVAYMPAWLMNNLNLSNDDYVSLSLRNLPKATKLIVQPEHYSFNQIHNPKATLEYWLRSFTCLTKGDVIVIGSSPSSTSRAGAASSSSSSALSSSSSSSSSSSGYSLIIVEVAPVRATIQPQAVCLVDTNVVIEFMEPIIKPPPIVSISHDSPISSSLTEGSLSYYWYRVTDRSLFLNIVLTPSDGLGDPSLFVSSVSSSPSLLNHEWASTNPGVQIITLPSQVKVTQEEESGSERRESEEEPRLPPHVYIAVYAYKGACNYTLTVSEFAPVRPSSSSSSSSSSPSDASSSSSLVVPARDRGHSLGSVSADAGITVAPANSVVCTNCRAYIPRTQLLLHENRCVKMNFYCELCKQVFKKSDSAKHVHCPHCEATFNHADALTKHVTLAHVLMTCECGQFSSMTKRAFLEHRKSDCSLRCVPCRYCSVEVMQLARVEHESYCGSKTVSCPICARAVVSRQLANHQAVVHGVNLSKQPIKGASPSSSSSLSSTTATSSTSSSTIFSDDSAMPKSIDPPPLRRERSLSLSAIPDVVTSVTSIAPTSTSTSTATSSSSASASASASTSSSGRADNDWSFISDNNFSSVSVVNDDDSLPSAVSSPPLVKTHSMSNSNASSSTLSNSLSTSSSSSSSSSSTASSSSSSSSSSDPFLYGDSDEDRQIALALARSLSSSSYDRATSSTSTSKPTSTSTSAASASASGGSGFGSRSGAAVYEWVDDVGGWHAYDPFHCALIDSALSIGRTCFIELADNLYEIKRVSTARSGIVQTNTKTGTRKTVRLR